MLLCPGEQQSKNLEILKIVLYNRPSLKDSFFESYSDHSGESYRTNLVCWAIRNRLVDVLDMLVKMNADFNSAVQDYSDEEGEFELSPLHLAVNLLSKSDWSHLAMAALEHGFDEPYISLR